MQLQFFGASGTVTGSSSLLTTDSSLRILIDLGMFQGTDVGNLNYQQFPLMGKDISVVLLTHAHLDHCGRLPLLVKAGYTGKIYMTQATKLLVGLALMDAVKVATNNHNPEHPPLYSEHEVQQTLGLIQTVVYDEAIFLGKTKITFRNAGHILGAASIEIEENGKRIIFSGDIGNPQQKLLQPAASFSSADVVVMESTYGDRLHPQENAFDQLAQEIAAIESSGGVLILPAFALDRTQVLLHLLNHLKKEGKIKAETPVFLDSPMGIKATAIYKECHDLWSDEMKSHTDDPLQFPGLSLTEEAKDSEKILRVPGPKVIIAGNGMMNGGRVWHHLINYLFLQTTRVVVVGYQGQGTIGREIINGSKQVHIYHETVSVNATVTQIEGLSAHADQKQLLSWLHAIPGVKKVFLNHGEEIAREKLQQELEASEKNTEVILPQKDMVFEI